jgi:hypothetical protein
MKPVLRSELLDLGAYEAVREHFRARVIAEKRARYVSLGNDMTALFENRESVLLQIQEMLRTERITRESAILHELETYNELLPSDHQLSLTVFVEYPEREDRDRMLRELVGLERGFYFVAGGERAALRPDPRGTDPTRTLAVHYIKFDLTEAAERALASGHGEAVLGVDHPVYRAETRLAAETRLSLRRDFEG